MKKVYIYFLAIFSLFFVSCDKHANTKEDSNLVEAKSAYQRALSSESDGNDSDAFYYFKRSADLGYSPAQASLGLYYLRGKCVNKDKEKALEYFKKSAKQGNRSAQHYIFLYNVITIIEDATGPQKDYIPAETKVKMFDDVFRSARELAAQDNEVAQVLTFVLCTYEDKILEELKKEGAK